MKHSKTLIVTFANFAYKEVLANWLAAIKKLGIENYCVISLDMDLHELLQKNDIPTLLKPCDLGLNKLWIHRVEVISELLKKGYDVLHSDADAVWMQNPLEEYIYDTRCDFVFSQGTYWPLDIHKVWKFVLCCGFFYIKAKDATLQLMQEWLIDVKIDQDDQRSLNKLLYRKNLQWHNKGLENYELQFHEKNFICYNDIVFGELDDIKIALLPHGKFQRVYESSKDAYVLHIISEKSSGSIMEVLKETNCLFEESMYVLKKEKKTVLTERKK